VRIGTVYKHGTPNAEYRAVLPLRALERRGHQVLWPSDGGHLLEYLERRRPTWEVTLIQQRCAPEEIEAARRLRAAGVAVVWDTDDNVAEIPRDSPAYPRFGGRKGVKRLFEATVEMAREATVMTTPSHHLAELYRGHGARNVAVIENYVDARQVGQPRRRTPGIVIGICAAFEHKQDIEKLKIAKVLQAILDRHEAARVISIGFDFKLKSSRYARTDFVPFDRLIAAERSFDIGLAPLVDSPFARARSNIKLKEYAAAGAMWLASPVGPYVGMGEEQGGLLVDAGDWFDALDALVADYDRRFALAARARAWAAGQTVDKHVRRWEQVLRAAAAQERSAARAAAV
jgi:hypothetical protein